MKENPLYVVFFIVVMTLNHPSIAAPCYSFYELQKAIDHPVVQKTDSRLRPSRIRIGLKSNRYKEDIKFYLKDTINLPSDAVWFSMDFARPDSFGDGYKSLYKIVPLMDEYTEMPIPSQITLSGISAGKYFISVQLRSLISGEAVATHTWMITKKPAFMETPLFYAMICFGIGGIGGYILYERSRRTKNEYRLRRKISRDLHDEVGGLLAGISMQVDLLRLKMGDYEMPSIEAIGEHSRQSIQMMDDIIWAVDARNNDQESLGDRMKYVASQLLEPLEIEINFELEPGESRKVAQTVLQNLYLIFKEAVHNICKHSDATAVRIGLHFTARNIELYVQDNGTGTAKKRVSHRKGNGLRNMQLRAEQIGAQLYCGYTQGGYEVRVIAPNYEGRLLKWLKF